MDQKEQKIKEYKHKYYLEHKEKYMQYQTKYRKENSKRCYEYTKKAKWKKVKKLREEGVTNAWMVVNYSHPKKYRDRLDHINLYDNTYNYIATFFTYKECAAYFNTSAQCIYKNITRDSKKRYKGQWYKLIPVYRKKGQ